VTRRFLLALLIALAFAPSRLLAAATDDGYDSDLAHAVRSATQRYRLVVWAEQDGYVQTTDYIASFGTMYTNHKRFDPADLSEPTVLIYDLAGRLLACGYQYLDRTAIMPALAAPGVSGWYDIPQHLHYNIVVDGTTYYAQAPWSGDEQPTATVLVQHKLMPANAKLLFAFVHPATHAIIIWAWTPNPDGLFGDDDPALP